MTMGLEEEEEEEEEANEVFVESPSCVQSVFPDALLVRADA